MTVPACTRAQGFAALLLLQLAVALSVPSRCRAQPHAPKLHPPDLTPAPLGVEAEAPARKLPEQVVICIDHTAARCWSATRGEECRGAEVFRVVARGDGSVAHGDALTECWERVRKAEAP